MAAKVAREKAGEKAAQTAAAMGAGTEERAEAVCALIDSGSNIVLFIASTEQNKRKEISIIDNSTLNLLKNYSCKRE